LIYMGANYVESRTLGHSLPPPIRASSRERNDT